MDRVCAETTSHRSPAFDWGLWAVATVLVGIEATWGPGLTSLHLAAALALFMTLGLPHGALDAWIWNRTAPDASRVLFFAGYFGLMALVIAMWALSPRGALWAFLALAVHHFGEAEVIAPETTRLSRALLRITRGALVVGVPTVLHADEVEPVVSAMGVPGFGFAPSWAWVAGVGFVAAHVAALAGARALPRRTRIHEMVQALVLAAMFATLHPLLSFALYFTLWHALSHLGELRARWPDGARPQRLVRRGGPFAVAATVGLLIFVQAAPGALDASVWAGRSLVVVSVLTLPHAVLVSLMRTGRLRGVERWACARSHVIE